MTETAQTSIGPASVKPEGTAQDSEVLPGTAKPSKALPTTRAKLESQLAILRAFAAASGPSKKAVQNGMVADVANVSPSTVSSCNSFYADIGLLAAVGRGYVPADTVFEFARAWEWNQDTAACKLAPNVEGAWFWELLKARLSFRPLTDDEAIEVLASAAAAGPAYRPQLLVILELLAAVGLIVRENGSLRRNARSAPDQRQEPRTEAPSVTQPVLQVPPANETPTTNAMRLSMDLKVPMDQMSKWDAEKVQRFFSEWANLMNAKAAIERMLNEES